MPYLYVCSRCSTGKLQRGSFSSETDRGPVTRCPLCGKKRAERKRAYKTRSGNIRYARNMDVAATLTERARRKSRGVQPARFRDDDFEMVDIAAENRAYDPVADAGAEDDAEYVARVQFNPAMRLTADGAPMTCRPRNQMVLLCQNALTMTVVPPHLITAAAGRVDTGSTMARYLKVGRPALATWRTLSAYTWANWGARPPTRGCAYTRDPKRSLEWCHLVADSLGGPTIGTNLVAASYAANTQMLAIEQQLHARTTIRIEITAGCCQENVAEFLDYKIIRPDAAVLAITIDARNDYFTRADYAALGQQVANFLR